MKSVKLILLLGLVPVIYGFTTSFSLGNNPDDVHFFLFPNSKDTNTYQEITYNQPATLANSLYNKDQKTVFIIHGFRSNVTSDMPQTLKNAFLAANLGYNVIVVSWGDLATPLPAELTGGLYMFVLGNVPVVATRVAAFIQFLVDQKMTSLDKVYLIGHSLGAHVSGLTGRNIFLATGQKIPRITGLDPAGPFYYPTSPDRNILPEDAKFVDIIHTNMFLLGEWMQTGHADFYPNGGLTQPNCKEADLANIATLGRCSHWYAYKLYAASLTQTFPACPCESPFLVSYQREKCKAKCSKSKAVNMGYYCSPTASGGYFAITPPLP